MNGVARMVVVLIEGWCLRWVFEDLAARKKGVGAAVNKKVAQDVKNSVRANDETEHAQAIRQSMARPASRSEL